MPRESVAVLRVQLEIAHERIAQLEAETAAIAASHALSRASGYTRMMWFTGNQADCRMFTISDRIWYQWSQQRGDWIVDSALTEAERNRSRHGRVTFENIRDEINEERQQMPLPEAQRTRLQQLADQALRRDPGGSMTIVNGPFNPELPGRGIQNIVVASNAAQGIRMGRDYFQYESSRDRRTMIFTPDTTIHNMRGLTMSNHVRIVVANNWPTGQVTSILNAIQEWGGLDTDLAGWYDSGQSLGHHQFVQLPVGVNPAIQIEMQIESAAGTIREWRIPRD